MYLTFKCRLLTKRTHRRALERAREASRILYNAALQERISAWEHGRQRITYQDQCRSLTTIRSEAEQVWGEYGVNMGRWALKRLDDAFSGFFNRVKGRKSRVGFPRYRSASRWDSFGFAEWSGLRLGGDRLTIKGVAQNIRVNLHRPLPDRAQLCSAVITEQLGIWYICIQLEVPTPEKIERAPANTVGCDWGIENSITTDDGRVFDTVAPGRDRAAKVRRAQRAINRCKRGGRTRRKRVAALGRLRRAEANARATRLHQISAALVRTTPFVAVEDLSVKNMTTSAAGTTESPGRNVKQKSGLNRSILDGAPAKLVSFIRYKAERAGGGMQAVNPRGTSVECAACGAIVAKTLATRYHECPCGFGVHRDFNAACNIRHRAFGDTSRAVMRFRLEPDIKAVLGLEELNVVHEDERVPGNIVPERIPDEMAQ